MSHLSLATLHLANTCPVVRIKDAMVCRVRWIWICVSDRTISGRSFARHVADHLAGNDGLHGSSPLSGWFFGNSVGSARQSDQLRPVVGPVRTQIPAAYLQTGFTLNADRQIRRTGLQPIHHVLQVAFGGCTPPREFFACFGAHGGEERFEVHGRIKPFGFNLVKTIQLFSFVTPHV